MIYHILNGDALKEQLAGMLEGEVIIFRECLVEGPVLASNYEEFFRNRAEFLRQSYGTSLSDYNEFSAAELRRINDLPISSEINLWFEDDLFCQANLWYAVNQLKRHQRCYLVRPKQHDHYGFGGYDTKGLKGLLTSKVLLNTDLLSTLWEAYCDNNTMALKTIGETLESRYPFLRGAISAHIDRQATGNSLGRPKETLQAIIDLFETEDFGKIFQEFSRREPIYGYGDLQVRRLLKELKRQT